MISVYLLLDCMDFYRQFTHSFSLFPFLWLSAMPYGAAFSLIQNRTDDFSSSFAPLGRKRLQPFPQTFATLLVMTAVVHAEDHYVLAGTVSVHWHCDAVGSAQALLRFGQR